MKLRMYIYKGTRTKKQMLYLLRLYLKPKNQAKAETEAKEQENKKINSLLNCFYLFFIYI